MPLRVETVDDEATDETSGRIWDSTTVQFEERAACGRSGGWTVRSEAGR